VLGLAPALRTHLVTSAALAALVAGAVVAQAEAISRALPRLVEGDGAALRPLAGALVVVAVVRAVAAWATERSATRALLATRAHVRMQVLDRLEDVRSDHRHQLGPAEATTLTTTAIDALEPWIRAYLPGLTLAVAVPLAAGARILGADVLSAVILALVVPLIPIFMVLVGRATESQQARQWDALARLARRFLDVITGLPTLRLFGRAEAQVERVREVTDRYRQATLGTLRVAFLSALVLELLATLSVAVIAVALGIRLIDGDVTLQAALLVLLLAPECLLPIRRVAAAFHAATAGVDAATEIDAVLAVPRRCAGTAAAPLAGELVATAVTVRDAERGVRLAPTDLHARPGTIVAVTGPSGAGKSTLLDVLRGAIEPDQGTVRVGDVDLGELPLVEQARRVRWVPQRPRALGTTVRASAALGIEEGPAPEPAVDEVLDELGLADLAERSPAAVSGGERRRTGLARALVAARLGEAPVVLADEPTAQLDPVSAERVRAALRATADRGAAVIVATHDPLLVAMADTTVPVGPPARGPEAPDQPDPALGAALAEHRPRPEPKRTLAATSDRPRVTAAPVPDAVPGWGAGRAAGDATLRPAAADRTEEPDAAAALRWVAQIARPRRWRLVGAALLGALTDACTIALAATAAWLIVRAAEQPSFADLAVAAVGVRAFGVGKGVLRYAERLASHDATLRLLADLRAAVVARLARLAPTGLPAHRSGDLMARLVDDIDRLQDLFLRVAGPAAAGLAVALTATFGALLIDPLGAVALLAVVLVVGVVLPLLAHRTARARTRRAAAIRGDLAATVVDLAEGAEELVAAGAAHRWRAEVAAHARRLDDVDRRQGARAALLAGATAAAAPLATVAVALATGPAGPGLAGPAVGVMVLLPLAIVELLAPLSPAGEALARVEASAARVVDLVRRPDPVAEPVAPASLPAGSIDLELRAATIAWPGGAPVVSDADLRVPEGGRVLITGPSGSGKSTLAALLVRFLDPVAGRYEVGGVAAPDIGGEEVRRLVTWVEQDPWFADSTLADNLRIARPAATDEELREVLRVVHLDAWERALPQGLATRLERDASAMSGGERQRLALARALLGGHRAIVLDEPTAHLDAATAHRVRRDLLEAAGEASVVVIAHDLDAADLATAATAHRLLPHPGSAATLEPLAPPA
jgi:ATP-binding cassette subfamily C protein CydCD